MTANDPKYRKAFIKRSIEELKTLHRLLDECTLKTLVKRKISGRVDRWVES